MILVYVSNSLAQFMHEVGHNFNSGHTHDGGYSPRVDTCGCPQSNGRCTDPCPSQLPLAKSATIMSYCHLCSGGYPNIDYTFGGKYSGTGSRGSIFSYSNSPLAGTVSNNPRQVNARMWNHVSTRGICTQPNNPVRNLLNTVFFNFVGMLVSIIFSLNYYFPSYRKSL
jgi:hypothetical protein